MRNRLRSLLLGCVLLTTLTSCIGSSDPNAGGGRLQQVINRGKLKCGISGELPGFSFIKPDGEYAGLDVDICKAIAAAVFDDPTAVEYRPLNAKERFTALQSGEIDVLSRNTTWTLGRDASNKLAFAPVVFYDSQGIMVRQNSGITKLTDFQNKSICTQTGTTTERNITDQMRKLGVTFTPVVFEDVNLAFTAYTEGRCEAMTSDRSQLVSRRTKFPDAAEHVILPDVISKEPLAPAVTDGDDAWYDVVKWSIYALMEAEELGITSETVSTFKDSQDPVIAKFMGDEDSLGEALGLKKPFAAQVIQHVGNYSEIYERNLGPQTPLKLERGQNKLWNQGGLLYSMPFR